MTTRNQVLRSSTPGQVPAAGTRLGGELWVNFPDHQIGYIDASKTAQKAIAVRFFSTSANYASGDFVVQAGGIWVANTSITAGAFNPSQWRELAYLTDIPAIYVLPIATTSVLGGVKVDGVTVQADANGVLSSAGLVTVSATAPSPVQNGALWYDLVGGQLYTWVNDGSSSQWVIAVNQNLAGGVWLPLTGGALSGAISGPMATFDNLSAPQAIGDNRIINGDMRIDQRNNGASGTAIGYTVDRWMYQNTQAGKITWSRNTISAASAGLIGFPYALYFNTTTAFTPTSTDNFFFQQPIEAEFVSDLCFGSANASPVTLSFWVIGAGGTYSGALCNASSGPTRCYPFTFPVTGTWAKIVVTIPGDTSGTWPVTGAGVGMSLRFDLGSGSNYRATAGAWASGNYVGATGAAGIVATNAASFYLTGVKLEIGSVATPYNRQSLAKSLADCQRYYQQWTQCMMTGYSPGAAANVPSSNFTFPVVMRTTPTAGLGVPLYSNASNLAVNDTHADTVRLQFSITGAGGAYAIALPLTLSAEL